MDLIYTDSNKIEKGILQEYELDIDMADEKDCSLKVDIYNNIMGIGSYFYIPGTEYGGVVDGTKIDTESGEIQYYGRNFRGLLNSKIILPPLGEDFKRVEGEVVESINELLAECHLKDIFIADEEMDISLPEYQFQRYCTLYEGLQDWLSYHGYNLVLEYDSALKKVLIRIEVAKDFSDYLTYCADNSVYFQVDEYKGGVNHLICLGSGNLAARRVIHLFTDENGGIQPYAIKDDPQEDADYILDDRMQLIFAADENVDVFDYRNAETRENYILLPEMPSDWESNYGRYFHLKNNEFVAPVASTVEKYDLLAVEPWDWAYAYVNYYSKTGNTYKNVGKVKSVGYEMQAYPPTDWETAYRTYFKFENNKYVPVETLTTDKYTKQAKKPQDWAKNYSIYYNKYSDGVTVTYKPVQGVAYFVYTKQTRKPSDWKTNFKSYYKKNGGEYENVTGSKAPEWSDGTYYTQKTKYKAPKWSKESRYTKSIVRGAPTWYYNKYYTEVVDEYPPDFVANTYYSYSKKTFIPTWYENTYYKKASDHYADLVENGIKRLKELSNSKSQTVKLQELDARIGDTVGGQENITGIKINEVVRNIIVKIKNGILDTSYEVGGF